MGADAKHFYRFTYLKSEHWQNLRLEKLASVDACCQRCGHRDLSNDVHHLRYRKLFDVTKDDLLVLCRACHSTVHDSMDAVREAIDAGGNASVETWIAFVAVWGEKPHRIRELGSIMRDMRQSRMMPRTKVRRSLRL